MTAFHYNITPFVILFQNYYKLVTKCYSEARKGAGDMDLRQQVINRILKLNEEDLKKVIAYLEKNQENASNPQAQNRED